MFEFMKNMFKNEYVEFKGNWKRFICSFIGHKWVYDNDDPYRDMWGWGTCSRCNRRENL